MLFAIDRFAVAHPRANGSCSAYCQHREFSGMHYGMAESEGVEIKTAKSTLQLRKSGV
jgi:hypothetical protein